MILKEISESYNELADEYSLEKESIDVKIKALAKYFSDIMMLAKNQGDFYSYRQTLVSKRREKQAFLSTISREINSETRLVLNSYKLGKKLSEYATDVSMRPSNDTERTMYINDDLKDVLLVTNLISSHIQYLDDSIATLNSQLLGINYCIKLQDYK